MLDNLTLHKVTLQQLVKSYKVFSIFHKIEKILFQRFCVFYHKLFNVFDIY